MLYHPGSRYLYALGTERDLNWYGVPADYHYGVVASGNSPELPQLKPIFAYGLAEELGRDFLSHGGGTWKSLSTKLSDEEVVLLAESAHWRAATVPIQFRPFFIEGDDVKYHIY